MDFLDYTITLLNGRIITDVHDKRNKMDVYANSRTFPHRESLMSNKVRYNILTSQFIRYGRRCSRFRDFLRSAVTLTANMLRHGYNRRLVKNRIFDFGRYWRRHCLHLGRFHYFEEAFPVAINKELRERDVTAFLDDARVRTR